MCALSYIALSDPPLQNKQKKFAPSLTEDMNAPKFPLEQRKMKTACNSAYVETETKFHFRPASRHCLLLYLIQRWFKPQTWLLSESYNLLSRNSYNLRRRSQDVGNGVTLLHIFRQFQL